MQDIVAPASTVEVRISYHGDRVWVNIDGVCALRICKIKNLILEDDRYPDALGEGDERTVNTIVRETSEDVKINAELEKQREQREIPNEEQKTEI
jgi:hypothetical protein